MRHRIIHHSDADGLCSAAIVAYYLIHNSEPGQEFDFIPINYGQELSEEGWDYQHDHIYMVDFSLQPDDKMLEFIKRAARAPEFLWIDHHATAVQLIEKNKLFFDGLKHPFVVETERDGEVIAACELTWQHFFPNLKIPSFVWLIGAWDTWRWKNYSKTEGAQARILALQTWLKAFMPPLKSDLRWWRVMLDDQSVLPNYELEEIIKIGKTLYRYQEEQDGRLMKSAAFEARIEGLRALVVNSYGSSQMFKSLYDTERHDLMIGFQLRGGKDGASPYLTVGLYTETTDRVHCGELAKKLGEAGPLPSGGGHPGAAGFQCTWEYFSGLLETE